MSRLDEATPEARARKRAKAFTALLWHAGAYVIVNAFLWVTDIAGGGGLNYAYWTTIPWGLGLGFHALAYYLDERGMMQRKYEQYLDEELRRGPQ